MKHLCYNDICTIISALGSLAMHKENLANILDDEKVRGYALRDKDEAIRLKDYFSQVADRLLDIDLGQSVRITATFRRGE